MTNNLTEKLLVEIAKPKKKSAEISEFREKLLRFAKVKTENARLKQIIEKDARHDAINVKFKFRVKELEARLVLLEQSLAVDGMVLSFGQIQAISVIMVLTVDVSDSVINQLNNEHIKKALIMRLKRGGEKKSREIKEQDKQDLLQFYEELKQQLSSPTHIFTSDQTLEEQNPSSNIT
ncbi:hypothetical protein GLOIN_2v1776936 [Rhizophagus irregularis DAOM 181602=DAOM 197198]|uniref:Uncharacterized protein n=1 Tax=Rhizophagus irregularis (strain DAOM 181602 / DAOM 197198 / MUCL 43194) TaxID=747089 RepID=A0A2P4PVT8_RHIID|nr:hypothetical protein GLOIN_2v1776936 [Rhizophagus irregularis DAOM 181602=DAOM 197198]POG69480.1 hypothetical protein GLOIN_2v1776936 [Rhizophagus irregularis DAOM 181602=DAOM 197198]|eukprot:XP_025176346.1 hypothetical protein GLOIN_2v1776936 [Rhizophagus irregularis DAOM 181602=DAOM 197198]